MHGSIRTEHSNPLGSYLLFGQIVPEDCSTPISYIEVELSIDKWSHDFLATTLSCHQSILEILKTLTCTYFSPVQQEVLPKGAEIHTFNKNVY